MKTTGHIFKFMTQSIAARYSMFGGSGAGEVGSHHRRRYRYEAAARPSSRVMITRCELAGGFAINALKTAYGTWCATFMILFVMQLLFKAGTGTFTWCSTALDFMSSYFHVVLEYIERISLQPLGGSFSVTATSPWYQTAMVIGVLIVAFGPALALTIMTAMFAILIVAGIAVAVYYFVYVILLTMLIAIIGNSVDRVYIWQRIKTTAMYFTSSADSIAYDHYSRVPLYTVLIDTIHARVSRIGNIFKVPSAGRVALPTSTSSSKLSAIKAVICKPIEITED